VPYVPRAFGPTEGWKVALAWTGLGIWMLMLAGALRVKKYQHKLGLCCAAPVLTMALVPLIWPVEEFQDRLPESFFSRHGAHVDSDTVIVSDRTLFHSLAWFFRRCDVLLLLRRSGELEYGLAYRDAAGRVLNLEGFRKLVERQQSRHARVVMFLP